MQEYLLRKFLNKQSTIHSFSIYVPSIIFFKTFYVKGIKVICIFGNSHDFKLCAIRQKFSAESKVWHDICSIFECITKNKQLWQE